MPQNIGTFRPFLRYFHMCIYIYIFRFSIFDYIYKNLVNMLNGKGCTMSKGTTNRSTILVISVMIAMISSFRVALLRQVRLNLYRNRLWHCGLHWVRSPTWRGPQNRCCRRSTKQAATNKIGFETISKRAIFIIIRLIYITIRKTPNRKIRKTVVWGGECSALCGSFVAGASTK